MTVKLIIDLSIQWFEKMWSKPDLSLADKLVDSEYHPSWIFMNKKGPELIKYEITHFRSIFPDLDYKIIDFIAQHDKVWLRYMANGTQKGTGWGFEPTNKYVEFEGAAILYFDKKNQVVDLWESYCFYDILEELGLVPPLFDLHKYLKEFHKI